MGRHRPVRSHWNIQEREIMVTWTGVIEVESRTVGRCWSYLSGKINKTYSDDWIIP